MRKILVTLSLLFIVGLGQAQLIPIGEGGSASIEGVGNPQAGNSYTYSYFSLLAFQNPTWSVTGGYVNETHLYSDNQYRASIIFTSSGAQTITLKAGSFTIATRTVLVQASATPPAMPSSPSVSSNNCGNKTLTRGNPPSGVTWYWQTSSNGTSTSNSSSTYTVTSSRTVYLRARGNSSGLWSSSRAKSVTVKPKPGRPSTPSVAVGCGSSTATRGNPPSGITWYWQTSSSGTSTSNSSSTYTVSSSRNVYLRARNNSTGCWGSTRTKYVAVTTAPAQPAAPLVSNVCGQSVLSYNEMPLDLNAPPGVATYWQTSANGTSTSNPTTTDKTVTSSGTVYVRAKNTLSGCWSTARAVSVTVKQKPSKPSTPSVSAGCSSATLTKGSQPSGITWYWQGTNSNGTSTSNSSSTYTANSNGTYYIRARNNSTGCWSSSRSVGVTLHSAPAKPSTPSVSVGCGSSTATRGNPPSGITWYWQTSSSGTNTSNSSSTYTVTSSRTVYLRARRNSTGCWSSTRSVSVGVSTPPTQPSAPLVSNVCGQSVVSYNELPGQTPPGVTMYWQTSSGGTSTSNPTSTDKIVTSSGTVYVRAKNTLSGCWSTARAISVTVKQKPAKPSTPSVSPGCTSATLTKGSQPSGITWYWQGTNSNGTSTSNSSNTYTANSNGTYYIRARNNSTGCWSSSRSVSVTLNPAPARPSTPSVSVGCGSSTATRSNPPSGITWYWQTSSGGTSTSNSSSTYTVSSTRTVYLRARNNSTGCWSSARSVSVNVSTPPAQPSAPLVSNVCGQSIVSYSEVLVNTPPGVEWYWQTSASGTSTSNSYGTDKTVTSSGTVYVRAKNTLSGCWSTARAISVTVKQKPAKPSTPSVAPGCTSATLTKGSQPSGITWYWQGTNSNGTSTSNSSNTYTANSNGTYYIRARNNSTGCWSSSRSVGVTLNPAPARPSTPSVSIGCGSSTATRSNPPSGITWYWQTSSGGTSTSNSSSTYTVSSSRNVYLRARNNSTGCWSSTRTKYVTVNTPPTQPDPPLVSNVCGQSILSYSELPIDGLVSPAVTWYWQTSASGTSTSNATSQDKSVTSSGTVYVRAHNSLTGCWSTARAISVTVSQVPSKPSTPSVAPGCTSATLTKGSQPSGVTWYWQGTNSNGASTSNSSSTYTANSEGTYYIRARNNSNGCWSASRSVNVTFNPAPAMPSTPSVAVGCGSSTATRSNPPSGFTWYWQTSSGGTSTGNSSSTYTVSSSRNVYLRARNNSTGCWSSTRTKYVSVSTPPAQPGQPLVSEVCGQSVVSYSEILVGGNPEPGTTWYWQTSASGTSTSNSTATDKTVTASGTVYVRALNAISGCWSTATSVSVSVKQVPPQPAAPSVSSNSCGDKTLTRGNPPSGITWYWQSSANGTSTSNSSVNWFVSTSGTYYLRARSSQGCWSAARSISTTVTQPTTWYLDSDGDGFGNLSVSTSACVQPAGYVADNTDCNDSDAIINPNTVWYYDGDQDGYGSMEGSLPGGGVTQTGCDVLNQDFWVPNNLDCNDSDASVNPDKVWYRDQDGDGKGNASVTTTSCLKPSGYVSNTLDCDDGDANLPFRMYTDADGDGYGSGGSVWTCTDLIGYATNNTDCNDSNADYHVEQAWYLDADGDGLGVYFATEYTGGPILNEEIDGLITPWAVISCGPPNGDFGTLNYVRDHSDCNDRDSSVGAAITWYQDNDGDGYGTNASTMVQCWKPAGYAAMVGDCDDADSLLNPMTVWYFDDDGDGFGNNFKTFTGCTPPADYVLNGDDACPSFYGTISGCSDFGMNVSQNISYVIQRQFRVESQNPTQGTTNTTNITYYDGIGRPVQSTLHDQSPTYQDVVQFMDYDVFGRQKVNYLPYTSNLNGALASNPIADQTSFYANGVLGKDTSSYAKSISLYENYPGGPVIEQGMPGYDWQPVIEAHNNDYVSVEGTGPIEVLNTASPNATIKNSYSIASASEIHYWEASTGLPALKSVLATLQLYKNSTIDADGNETIEYSNSLGQTVLKKSRVDATTWAETYYIYDEYGNLTTVLPPEASARLDAEYFGQSVAAKTDFLNTWAFLYDYDSRKRMIMKKVPGADSILMIYDRWDRLVLTQDGLQRESNEWLFTKYDGLNRPIMTGIMTGGNVTVERAAVATESDRSESLNASGVNQYTDVTYPSHSKVDQYFTVTYYDNYDYQSHVSWSGLGLSFADPESLLSYNTHIKGQVTGTMINDGEGDWIRSASYYDDKYRMIQTRSTNHLGGTDVATNYFDFIGQLDKSISTHSDGAVTTKVTRRFQYDQAGRLLYTYHQLNSDPEVLISSNTYNELGELIEKDLHGETGSTFAQSVDYTYNIRGWLKSINDSDLNASNDGDLFGFNLSYNQVDSDLSNNTLYNGNITSMKWSVYNDEKNSDIKSRAYRFEYDQLNRLTEALSNREKAAWGTSNQRRSKYAYDLNGNIQALERRGKSSDRIDSLLYAYIGNQLTSVSDATADTLGFMDGNTIGDDYSYDANGNMVQDLNKEISNIKYNHLNLPIKVEFETAGDSLTYRYDAAGIKLSQSVYKGGSLEKKTDYVGEFIYEDGELQLIQHEEGRIVPKDSDFDYQYHLKDHLGNVRLTFSTTPESYVTVQNMESKDDAGNEPDQPTKFVSIPYRVDVQASTSGNEVATLGAGETGVMIFIGVQKRDTLTFSVNANYIGNQSTYGLTNLAATAILNGYNSGAPTGQGLESNITTGLNDGVNELLSGGIANKASSSSNAPRAYINYIYFNEDMSFRRAGFKQISTAADGLTAHELITLEMGAAEVDGFVLAYLTNETTAAVNVNFDDFIVNHGKTNVVSSQDYYPFGLSFNESSRMASEEQRFKYNGMEVDDNTGLYDYGARYFDPVISRFVNIDPASYNYQSWTPYHYVMNNPIIYVDPTGMFTELYNENGKKIGEDENGADGNIAIVKDKEEADRVKQNYKDGKHTESSSLKSTVNLPSAYVRGEMGKAVERAGNNSFHEEGGYFGSLPDGTEKVVHAKPGDEADPRVDGEASIDVWDAADPSQVDGNMTIEGTFHTHPNGKIIDGPGANTIGGETKTSGFRNEPSTDVGDGNGDIPTAKANSSFVKGNSYVLAQGNKTVYIYNGGGVVAKFPLKKFTSIGIKKK